MPAEAAHILKEGCHANFGHITAFFSFSFTLTDKLHPQKEMCIENCIFFKNAISFWDHCNQKPNGTAHPPRSMNW